MKPESPSPDHGQIAVFYQRHRTGLVTLVFTDLVDSTALMRQLGDQAGTTFLQQRRQIVRQTLKEFADGEEIETAGDSFLLIFAKPSDAVRFALLVQARFRAFRHEKQIGLLERIGIHLGEVVIKEHETEAKAKDLYGLQIGACARVMSLAQGGQVLMTRGVFDSARQVLKGEDIPGVGRLSWVSHGPYLLKGIEEPVEICEVGEVGQLPLSAPKTSEKAERYVTAESEPVLGWRPAIGQEVPNTKWVLEKKLGEGGFGEVWLGRHQTMKERRVFKFCFRADRVRSLKREMTLFRLIKERIGDHPNIVRLLGVYFDHPPYYVEMDHVEGQDLKSWCKTQGGAEQVPLEVKLEIVAQIAHALQAAHDAGVIHRDVKPGNILVSGQWPVVSGEPRQHTGEETSDQFHQPLATYHQPLAVKLTDFGIGQVVSQEYLMGVTRAGFTQTMLSSSSSQTGTQLYMAPELLAGKPASTRSDIYSLGVVLYQLLVGDLSRPVTTDWAKGLSDPLLCEDLQHCFAGNPDERFAGAAQLARNLRCWDQRRKEYLARLRMQRHWALRRRIALVSAGVAALSLLLAIAMGYGLRQARVARANETRLRQEAQAQAYAADMKAAQAALEQNDRGLAERLLRKHGPAPGEADLRGLEYRYLWMANQGDEKQSYPHPAMVFGATLSPDGRYLATADLGRIRIRDTQSGRLTWGFELELENPGMEWSTRRIDYSPDGRWLAMSLGKRGAQIRETANWSVVKDLKSASVPLGFSRNGGVFVANGTNGLEVWDVAAWKCRVITNAFAGLNNLGISADGSLIAYSPYTPLLGRLAEIELWDARKETTKTFARNDNPVSLTISPDGRWLASGHFSGELALWNLATGELVRRFRAHEAIILGLAFSPDGRLLATGAEEGLIYVWEVGSTNRPEPLRGHNSQIWSLSFSRDGRSLVSASMDGTAKRWSPAVRRPKSQTFRVFADAIPLGLLPDGSALVTAASDWKSTQIWSLPGGQLIRSNAWDVAGQQGCQQLKFFPRNQLVAGVGPDGKVHFWDLATGRYVRSVPLGEPRLAPMYLSPDNRWLLGGLPDGSGMVCDLQSARKGPSLRDWEFRRAAAFANNSRLLAYSATNYLVKILDLATGLERAALRGHRFVIGSLAFAPGDKILASGGWDNDVRLWSVDPPKSLLPPLTGHRSGVGQLAFSSDGKTLATGSRTDPTVRLWNVHTGQEMLSFRDVSMTSGQPAMIADAHLLMPADVNPGGKWLIWRERQGAIRVTAVPTLAEIDAAEKVKGDIP